MVRLWFVFIVAVVCLGGADQKPRKQRQTEIQVIEIAVHRSDGTIALDGRVRNTGQKPLEGLLLLFDFIDASNAVISTQKTVAEEGELAPGGEVVFRVQIRDEVRAVQCRVAAEAQGGRDVPVRRAGPFNID